MNLELLNVKNLKQAVPPLCSELNAIQANFMTLERTNKNLRCY